MVVGRPPKGRATFLFVWSHWDDDSHGRTQGHPFTLAHPILKKAWPDSARLLARKTVRRVRPPVAIDKLRGQEIRGRRTVHVGRAWRADRCLQPIVGAV